MSQGHCGYPPACPAVILSFKAYRCLYPAHGLHMENKHLIMVLKTLAIRLQTIFPHHSPPPLPWSALPPLNCLKSSNTLSQTLVLVSLLPLPSGEPLYYPLHQSYGLWFTSSWAGILTEVSRIIPPPPKKCPHSNPQNLGICYLILAKRTLQRWLRSGH